MPVDAVFAAVSERPIFAGASQCETDDPQFDVPLFPDPDGSDAADKFADFIGADSMT